MTPMIKYGAADNAGCIRLSSAKVSERGTLVSVVFDNEGGGKRLVLD